MLDRLLQDTTLLIVVVVAALALLLAAVALAMVVHLRTRVYALEQLQGLTTRRIRVIAEHVGIPLAVERRRHSGPKLPSGMEDRRRPLTDGPVPEGVGGHPQIDLPPAGARLSGDEARTTRIGMSVPMKGGQRVMGPQQPRPQVQDRIPSAPPRPPMPPLRPRRVDND